MAKKRVTQKTAQKTVQKTADDVVHRTVDRTVHRVSTAACSTGKWLWLHKKPILASITWLGLGTIIGAVRVIPPPANFVKLGLFRIAK